MEFGSTRVLWSVTPFACGDVIEVGCFWESDSSSSLLNLAIVWFSSRFCCLKKATSSLCWSWGSRSLFNSCTPSSVMVYCWIQDDTSNDGCDGCVEWCSYGDFLEEQLIVWFQLLDFILQFVLHKNVITVTIHSPSVTIPSPSQSSATEHLSTYILNEEVVIGLDLLHLFTHLTDDAS